MVVDPSAASYESSCCEQSRTGFEWTYVFSSPGQMPRSAVAELYRQAMFTLRNCRFPLCSVTVSYFGRSDRCVAAAQWCLHCVSLMASEVACLFGVLPSVSSSVTCLFVSFVHLLIELFGFSTIAV